MDIEFTPRGGIIYFWKLKLIVIIVIIVTVILNTVIKVFSLIYYF